MTARRLALLAVLVIALEHAVAAPVCTRHLADQGADLGRADVDADQDRFPFHLPVVPRCRSR